jgi:hypothetical protein
MKSPIREYITCKVVGHGYRFVPGVRTVRSRTDIRFTPGCLLGTVKLSGMGKFTRDVDSDIDAHPNEPVYDVGEVPTKVDMCTTHARMMETHPLGAERIVIKDVEKRPDGSSWTDIYLAPRGFVIPVTPTITEDTQPENTTPVAPPLEVTLGEVAAGHTAAKKLSRYQAKLAKRLDKTLGT